ncbi:MAG: DUF4492 domain-containing protein [Bacteroidales bacterium]|nr:DUF4492 domain-containing protein [Bacteroidales bacterium]MBN2634354.1 DUF4492 domain-containing protein [Bacteroidales bacterium]
MKNSENDAPGLLTRIFRFYYEGFTNMSSWGRKVWIIIIIKLFLIFVVLKIFFFPDFLSRNYENDEQRSEYVLDQITKTPEADD